MKLSEMVRAALRPVARWCVDVEERSVDHVLRFAGGSIVVSVGKSGTGFSACTSDGRTLKDLLCVTTTNEVEDLDFHDRGRSFYASVLGRWIGAVFLASTNALTIRGLGDSTERWALHVRTSQGRPVRWEWSSPTWERNVGDLKLSYTSAVDNERAYLDYKRRDAEKKAQVSTAEAA